MRQVLVYVYPPTNEVAIIHSLEDESQLAIHGDIPGYVRYHVNMHLPINHSTGTPLFSLSDIGDAIQKMTGNRPSNT